MSQDFTRMEDKKEGKVNMVFALRELPTSLEE